MFQWYHTMHRLVSVYLLFLLFHYKKNIYKNINITSVIDWSATVTPGQHFLNLLMSVASNQQTVHFMSNTMRWRQPATSVFSHLLARGSVKRQNISIHLQMYLPLCPCILNDIRVKYCCKCRSFCQFDSIC